MNRKQKRKFHLESEYARLYPSKKDENEKFAYIQGLFQESADKMDMLFALGI